MKLIYTISRACVGCGSCAGACPRGAIHGPTAPYRIDSKECDSCGICQGVCPVLAISSRKEDSGSQEQT